ncbi:recombinase family protein [Cryobacterium sp. SO1]|uniref:recombinase family protein n=1 Tax=Cryobacterium sp. SO1 TaxID=1897061 RepID=UPI001023CA24|nr:recombinase family protein [Cryobacterium sp. SO1]RZI34696.1 putative transposon Tn552 DNA-invertase bin3 [Cryobacterium sp. SO1]
MTKQRSTVRSGRVYGYARVSSTDQNLDRQRDALDGVDVLVEEKVSGKNRDDREKLRTLMAFAQPGDTIRVKSIDRLARNTRDLLAIIDEMLGKEVAVDFVDTPQLSVSTKEGRAMITIFAAFAELERESIRERQLEGIALAKAAGKYEKSPKLSPEQISLARECVNSGVAKSRVARDLSVSRQTLHSALSGVGKYAQLVGGIAP